MTEFELKLEIPPVRLAGVAAALAEVRPRAQRLQARYFDTAGGALARHGIAVRVRKEGRRWVQTAKAPGGRPMERLEHNAALVAGAAGADPVVDLARHEGTAAGASIRAALKLDPGQAFPPLVPLYATDVRRRAATLEAGACEIEIALDQGRIVSGERSLPVCELELELKRGRPEDAVQLARRWCAAHGLWLSSISKPMKGQRLAAGQAFGPAVHGEPPRYGHHADGCRIAGAALAQCLDQVAGNASEVAAGSRDAKHVHQLRIGIRRVRTALRELGPLMDGVDPAWEQPFVQAFRALGRYRDHDRLERELAPRIEGAGGPAVDPGQAGGDVPDPVAVVRAPAFQDALLSLIGLAYRLQQGGGPDRHDAWKLMRKRLETLRAQVVRDGLKFPELGAIRQHGVRKRVKRLRYLAQFAAAAFGRRRSAAFVAGLIPVQEALGLYHDELVALRAYGQAARRDPAAWFGVGWLEARRVDNAGACQQALQDFARVRPFWEPRKR